MKKKKEGFIVSEDVDSFLYCEGGSARKVMHPGLRIGNFFLDDMLRCNILEKVMYEEIIAQHYGPRTDDTPKKLVAIITIKVKEGNGFKTKQTIIVEGEKPWKNWFDKVHQVVLSPDGERLAAIVTRNGIQTAAINDEIWKTEFDQCFKWDPKFSPDGKRLAFAAVRCGAIVFIVNDHLWDEATTVLPDVYNRTSPKSWVHISDSLEIGRNHLFMPVFGPNGTCATAIPIEVAEPHSLKHQVLMTVVVEGKRWESSFEKMNGYWIIISEDGCVAVPVILQDCRDLAGRKMTIVVDEKPWNATFETVLGAKFLPNGKIAAMVKVSDANAEADAPLEPVDRAGIAIDGNVVVWVTGNVISQLEYEVVPSRFSSKFSIILYDCSGPQKEKILEKKF